MAEFPALPLWTDAYIADTQHLTNEEHGVYMRLLMFAWRTPDCALPDDDRRLAIMVGVSPKKWATLKTIIMAFWKLDGGSWTQKKLTSEREFVEKNRKQKSAAGTASAASKALKSIDTGSTAVAEPLPTAVQQPIPIPISTTLSSVVEPHPQGDFDLLQKQLLEAAGDSGIHPHGAFQVGPIAELIAFGASLELDVIPTIKAIVSRRTKTVDSWAYFVKAIREAYERRVSAGKGLTPPPVLSGSDADWVKRLKFARQKQMWSLAEYGPRPGEKGCRVPEHLLETGDGVGWADMADQHRSAA